MQEEAANHGKNYFSSTKMYAFYNTDVVSKPQGAHELLGANGNNDVNGITTNAQNDE